MLSASKSLVSDDEAAGMKQTVLAVDCEVYGGEHVHVVVLGAAGEVTVDVHQIHIPVANDQNIHLRQALPSDVLVVLALGRQHAQRPIHREESTGKWCIHHAAPHAHLLLFWREADHFAGAGEELLDNHVCIGVKGGRFNSQQLAILHF